MVVFDRRASDAEKQAWIEQAGEAAVPHSEIAGLANRLLGLSQEAIARILRDPPKREREANFNAMTASNPIGEWFTECCMHDPNVWTQIGDGKKFSNREMKPSIEITNPGFFRII